MTVVLVLLGMLTIPPTITYAESDEELPQIWSMVDHLSWFSDSNTDVNQFTVYVDGVLQGRKTLYVSKHKNWVHIRCKLNNENNLIEIRTKEQTVFKKNVFYAPSWESETVPEEADPLLFHNISNEEPCKPCHRLTVEERDMQPPVIKEQLCYPCHQHKFDGLKSVHKPAVEEWRCLTCHQSEALESDLSPDQPVRFSVDESAGVAPICYKCHKKFKKHIDSLKYIHGPIGMGGCNMCHNPHGSRFDKLLQDKTNNLCIDCHELQDMMEQPFIHKAITKDGCIVCHNQHGSNFPLQLNSQINDLCYRCHPQIAKQKNNHPVQGHPVLVKGTKRDGEFKLTCVGCHSPHSSEYAKLLPEEEMMMLCAKCHSF